MSGAFALLVSCIMGNATAFVIVTRVTMKAPRLFLCVEVTPFSFCIWSNATTLLRIH